MKYKRYSIKTTTRYEAGDDSMKADLDANKASSNVLNRMARDAVAQERAAGGASIATPADQVLAARAVCFCCTLLDH